MEREKPPNILFILADQLGARYLPLHCHSHLEACHLTALGQQGAAFERAITTSPICTPYRACLLTGFYPSQTGVRENGRAYPDAFPSLADQLNERGYATHYLGKWHLSGAPGANRWAPPERRAGFQRFIGWESHHVDHYAGRIWGDDPDEAIEMPGHETDALTSIAEEELARAADADEPFFLLVSYQAPHPPCSPPREFHDMYAGRDLLDAPNVDRAAWYDMPQWNADYGVQRFRELYFGEISHLDAAVGRLLSKLDELGLRENTLVVFTSDHGEMAGAHGLFGKGVMYEEALHVPLLIRAPGQVVGRRIGMPAATVDLMPTLLDYAGGAPDDKAEGISLRPAIEGAAADEDRIVFSEYRDFCATTREWKLVTRRRTLEPAALYNIAEDPYELHNRRGDASCAKVQARLSQALTRWRERAVVGAEARAVSRSA